MRRVSYSHQQNEQSSQERQNTDEQYIVLPGHPFYGRQVRVLKPAGGNTYGHCKIEDPAHPGFHYQILERWLSPTPPLPQAPPIAAHEPIPLSLRALDKLVQIILVKDQQKKAKTDDRAIERNKPSNLDTNTNRTQDAIEESTVLSDTETDRESLP